MENIILKKTGFHTIRLVPRIKSRAKSESNSWNSHISSTAVAHDPPSAPNSDSFVLPPADILCTFIDGGVGLYNLDKRKWSFLRQMVRIQNPCNPCEAKFGIRKIHLYSSIEHLLGQWRSQPVDLVPLCKFKVIIITNFFENSLFSQSMNTKILA